jgi:phosphoribosyl 1,2-cyclic phosphate phosphodiesterase
MDDLRIYSSMQQGAIPIHGNAGTLQKIRDVFDYVFEDKDFSLGWGIPRLNLAEMPEATVVAGVPVQPVPILHGQWTILGYRMGGLAYMTDCSGIPEASWPLLEGLDTLIVGALRQQPHPTHFSISQALDVIARLRPRRAFLTHLSHHLDHAAAEASLPAGVRLAYDGLRIEAPL